MRAMLMDPAEVFRIGLRSLIASHREDIQIVADVDRADATTIANMSPDIVFMDLSPTLSEAAATIRSLRAALPALRVIIVSAPAPAPIARQVLAAGASAFIVKTQPVHALLAAIDEVVAGATVVQAWSPRARRPDATKAMGRDELVSLERLSPREREIFDVIVSGWSNKDIAEGLGISIKTVETHRGHINKKLGVHTTADIVRLASFHGLLTRPTAQPSSLAST